jgi:hypothetical protein
MSGTCNNKLEKEDFNENGRQTQDNERDVDRNQTRQILPFGRHVPKEAVQHQKVGIFS